jgi:hypothetical protein
VVDLRYREAEFSSWRLEATITRAGFSGSARKRVMFDVIRCSGRTNR